MRTPISYALLPFLLGIATYSSSVLSTVEYTAVSSSLIIFLIVTYKKGKIKLNKRHILAIFMGILLVFRIIADEEDEDHDDLMIKTEKLPPREMCLKVQIENIRKRKTEIGIVNTWYEAVIIEAPNIRKDIEGKKIRWHQVNEIQNRFANKDLVEIEGVVKKDARSNKEKRSNESSYFIYYEKIKIIKRNNSLIDEIRKVIVNSVLKKEILNDYESGFMTAMLIGDKTYLTIDQLKMFSKSGTMHLFAVSGLHVGIIYIIIKFILLTTFINSRLLVLISLLMLFVYVAICGYSHSAIRAFLMILLWQISNLLFKKTSALSSLYWAAFILLIYDEEYLFSIGFQLSFTVVLSIIYVMSNNRFMRSYNILNKITSAFFVSFSAFFGSFLLIIDNFHFINPLSIFINLFLVVIIFLIMIAIILYLLLDLVNMAFVLTKFIYIFYYLIETIIKNMNALTFSHIHFADSFDVPNVCHFILPAVIIFSINILRSLWSRVATLCCVPLLVLFFLIFLF